MHLPRVWFITGASSRLGRAVAEVLLRRGDIVVATLRNPSVLERLTKQYPPTQLLVLSLDVTRPSDISAAFTRTKEAFGRLDVVFNNSGYGIFGAAPDAGARALFDVNFWGMVHVSRAAIQFFREVNPSRKGGILLQHSFMMSYPGAPGTSYYYTSKHAIDDFSESLSKELPREWNIKICILQTGGFDTNAVAAGQIFPMPPVYANTPTTAREASDGAAFDGDLYQFADMLYRWIESIAEGQKMPICLPVGDPDALGRLEVRPDKLANLKVAEDAAPCSADLTKDHNKSDKTKTKL